MSKFDIKQEIDALTKALEAGKSDAAPGTLTQGAAFQIEELTDLSDKYLSDKAKQDLSNKARQLTVKMDNGDTFLCTFFGVRVRTGNEEKGAKAISKAINAMAKDGIIHSCLAPISSLKLARLPMLAQSSVILCYVLVPEDKLDDVNGRYAELIVAEGELPDRFEDLSPQLEDGEFLAQVNISPSLLSMLKPKDYLQEEIDLYLSVLPSDTVVKEIVNCAITDLSVPYEVRFYNPLLKKVKQVQSQRVRACAVVEGDLKEFKVFTGIWYMDAEGNRLFS